MERDTPRLAITKQESSDFQNSNSSKKEKWKYPRNNDTQNKLQQIELEVQQQQAEISQRREEAKFKGVKLDYFRPLANDEVAAIAENAFSKSTIEMLNDDFDDNNANFDSQYNNSNPPPSDLEGD